MVHICHTGICCMPKSRHSQKESTMISPKQLFAWATAAFTGALMAASFQTPAIAGDGPERADDGFRYDAPITRPIARPIAAPVAGYEVVTGTAGTAEANATGMSTAPCPGGKRVLGGGWTTGNPTTDSPVVTSASAIGNGAAWQVLFRNTGGSALTLTANAQCAFARPSAHSD
jgi:hypothetical protein